MRAASRWAAGLAAAAASWSLWLTPAAPAACKVGVLATLPVTMDGMRPTISAMINGAPTRLTIDSGAFFSVITPASAAEFQLKPAMAPVGVYMIGLGGTASMSIATVKSFGIAGHTFPNVEFVVGGSEIGNDGGGLLGQNFLGLADAEYDLASGVVRLMRPQDCARAALAYWSTGAYSMMDIEPTERGLQRKIIGVAYVNGARVRVEFDTGADHSVLWRRAARRAGVDTPPAGAGEGETGSGIGRNVYREWVAPVNLFKIGDEEIHHTQLMVADTRLEAEGAPDMLLGADFFLSHHVYVANSQSKLYFTYNGGPVFKLGAVEPTPVAADPTDADGFARRGAAEAARRQTALAITDLTRAVDMAPNAPAHRFERARVYMLAGNPVLARADLDEGLKLGAGDVSALILRAELRLAAHDKSGAIVDLDAAARSAPKEADARLALAGLYYRADALDRAVPQYDLWIKAHPDDSKRGAALNGRCRTRGVLNQDLDQALSDCNAAVRLALNGAEALDSRGLVYLRRGELDRAMADYDAALALAPRQASSLWGRGLTKLRKGMAAEGRADLAAATVLRPDLPDEARARGLAP